ncbi:MAG: hypothetical protein ACOH19_03170 [Rhodoglobus sp.]
MNEVEYTDPGYRMRQMELAVQIDLSWKAWAESRTPRPTREDYFLEIQEVFEAVGTLVASQSSDPSIKATGDAP